MELREDRKDLQKLIDIKERIKKEMDFNNLQLNLFAKIKDTFAAKMTKKS